MVIHIITITVMIVKLVFKESEIEKTIDEYMDSIVEYDSIVNQYFLPMIKQKIENPKEELEKELKNQNLNLIGLEKHI